MRTENETRFSNDVEINHIIVEIYMYIIPWTIIVLLYFIRWLDFKVVILHSSKLKLSVTPQMHSYSAAKVALFTCIQTITEKQLNFM